MFGNDIAWTQRPFLALNRQDSIDQHEGFIGKTHAGFVGIDHCKFRPQDLTHRTDGEFHAHVASERRQGLLRSFRRLGVICNKTPCSGLHIILQQSALQVKRFGHRAC